MIADLFGPVGDRVLFIDTTEGPDSVYISPSRGNSALVDVRITTNGRLATMTFRTNDFQRIVADLHGGDDRYENNTDKPELVFAGETSPPQPYRSYNQLQGNHISGGGGPSILIGGSGRDQLFGGGGDDWLYGMGGTDLLVGESGDDHLFGGDGVDTLFGDSGDDYLDGGFDNFVDNIKPGSPGVSGFTGESDNDTVVRWYFMPTAQPVNGGKYFSVPVAKTRDVIESSGGSDRTIGSWRSSTQSTNNDLELSSMRDLVSRYNISFRTGSARLGGR